VRQALAYAMPYTEIINIALKSRGERAYSYLSPKTPGYTTAMEQYQTDTSKAKALLTKAGVTNLSIPLYYDTSVSYNQDVVLLMQQSFAEAGITIEPNPQTAADFATDSLLREEGKPSPQNGMMIFTDAWWDEDAGSASGAYVLTGAIANWAHFSDSTVDSLYKQWAYSTDLTGRTAAFQKIQSIVAEQVPFIPIAIVGQVDAIIQGITNVPFVVDTLNRFHYMKLA